jgi:hypothetical protein
LLVPEPCILGTQRCQFLLHCAELHCAAPVRDGARRALLSEVAILALERVELRLQRGHPPHGFLRC